MTTTSDPKVTRTAYQCNENGVFLWPVEADPDQLQPGEHHLPRKCYWDEPPALADNQAAQRSADEKSWNVVADFIGLTYWLADGTTATITQLGVTPPEGYLTERPVPLSEVQQITIEQITSDCAAAITGGFTSSALGTSYHYPSTTIDQANLQAETTLASISITDQTWTTPLAVQDSAGNWSKKAHTAQQVIKVSQDFSAFRTAQIAKKDEYIVEINAAENADEVKAVVWDNSTD